MPGDRLGDAFATGDAGGDQVPGVALVLVAARLAPAGSAVAATDVGDAVELVCGAVPVDHLPGVPTQPGRGPDEADRARATPYTAFDVTAGGFGEQGGGGLVDHAASSRAGTSTTAVDAGAVVSSI
jgi:hypothetical protein